jgi:hypothetical protein
MSAQPGEKTPSGPAPMENPPPPPASIAAPVTAVPVPEPPVSSAAKSGAVADDSEMALFEDALKEEDWGHQPC